MVLFAQEIGGILIREYGYSITEVFHMRAKYAKQFDQQLYDIMVKFLRSHRQGGKPCVFHRPPTLERGSHQGFLIPDVEKDPRINVICMPNITTRAFNADYSFVNHCSFFAVMQSRRNSLIVLGHPKAA